MQPKSNSEARRALLLIDFQNDFLRDDGRMPVCRAQVQSLLATTRDAINSAQVAGIPIIAVGNEFPPGAHIANFFRRHAAIAGSPGARWDDRLPLGDILYFPKWKGDAFCNPGLARKLTELGTEEVILAGVYARGCISATARGALARGFRVRILAPAVACATDRSRAFALGRLSRRGVPSCTSLSG